jgi:hypothetical protein
MNPSAHLQDYELVEISLREYDESAGTLPQAFFLTQEDSCARDAQEQKWRDLLNEKYPPIDLVKNLKRESDFAYSIDGMLVDAERRVYYVKGKSS